jgi:hypothetical protein
MIADKALQNFRERYDREAVESVINLSGDHSLYMSSFKGFNIQEAVDQFIEYMDGYVKYQIGNIGKPNAKPNNVIKEHTKSFIETRLFSESNIPFNNAAGFIEGYLDNVSKLVKVANENQSILMECTGDNESIGCIVEFTDAFMSNLDNRFYPVMEHLLQSSGYYSRKKLRTPSAPKEQTFFL